MSNRSEIVIRANEDCLFKSEKYSLSSENVTNNFKIFRQDGTLCDVDLISGDTVVKAHRVVLAAGCVYFETMFKSGLEECNKKSVSLPSIAPDVLPLVVEFIYTDQTMINGSTVTHLVDAANMLQLQELAVGCAQYLGKHLHPSNVLGILRFAETYNLVKLGEEAFSYAEIHWCVVVNEEEFMDLSLAMLMKLLMSNKLVIESEVQVLHAILRWLHYKLQSRREHCLKLLELIRLREVPIEKLEYAITSVQDPVIKQYLEGFKSAMSTVAREPRRDAPNCLYVVGGNNRSTRRLRTAVMFNGKAWTQISPMSAPRLGPGVAALGGRMYAVGGQNYNFQVLASGEVYDPRANTWTPIAPMRTTRLHFALVAVSNKLYAFGGKGQSSIEAYDPMTNEWAEVGEMPEARWGMSFVTYAGAVYIVGGWTPTDACSNDVLRYAPARGEWRRLRPLLPAGDDGRTICATAAVHRQNLYVVGGWNKEGNAANAVRCYNLETEQSHLVRAMSVPRASCAAGVLGDTLVVAGGDVEDFQSVETVESVELYDLAEEQWRAGPALPEDRGCAGAAVL